MIHRARQSAFVLLMTLALVLLAGVMLAGVARRGMLESLEAQDAANELKRRWAIASCRVALLGNIDRILDEAERGEDRDGSPSERYQNLPLPEYRVNCSLAGIDYEFVFTDEQSKLNVNHLLEHGTIGQAQSIVTRLITYGGQEQEISSAIRLKTGTGAASIPGPSTSLTGIGSYSQIIDPVSPMMLLGTRQHPGLASTITCWGDGKINLRRASENVVKQACDHLLASQTISGILKARKSDPYQKLPDMLRTVRGLTDATQAKLAECLTDQSGCHGLWIIAHGAQRSWHTLAIIEGDGKSTSEQGSGGQWREFAW